MDVQAGVGCLALFNRRESLVCIAGNKSDLFPVDVGLQLQEELLRQECNVSDS